MVDELDYETKQNYELVIRATDSVSGVSAEVPVSVIVQDVNDCPPEIEKDMYNVSVSETTLRYGNMKKLSGFCFKMNVLDSGHQS